MDGVLPDPIEEETDICVIQLTIIVFWSLSLFVVAFSTSYTAFIVDQHKVKKIRSPVNCIGCGLLLGTCFFHLFPEALNRYILFHGHEKWDLFMGLLLTGILSILVLEQVASYFCGDRVFDRIGDKLNEFQQIKLNKKIASKGLQLQDLPNDQNGRDGDRASHASSSDINVNINDHDIMVNSQNDISQLYNYPTMTYIVAPTQEPLNLDQDGSNVHIQQVNQEFAEERVWFVKQSRYSGSTINIESQIRRKQQQMQLRILMMVLALSVHSIFDGIALAIQCTNMANSAKLGITLIPYKIAIGLSIAFQLQSKFDKRQPFAKLVLFIWSCFTPMGMMITVVCHRYVNEDSFNETAECINIVALGTFFYILFFEIAPEEFGPSVKGTDERSRKLHDIKMILKSLLVVVGCLLALGLTRIIVWPSQMCKSELFLGKAGLNFRSANINYNLGDLPANFKWHRMNEQKFLNKTDEFVKCMRATELRPTELYKSKGVTKQEEQKNCYVKHLQDLIQVDGKGDPQDWLANLATTDDECIKESFDPGLTSFDDLKSWSKRAKVCADKKIKEDKKLVDEGQLNKIDDLPADPRR